MRKICKYLDCHEYNENDRVLLEYNNHFGVDISNSEHACISNAQDELIPNVVKEFSYLKKR